MYTNVYNILIASLMNFYIISDVNESNERYTSADFKAKADCVMHGFAGYFESTLYGDVIMSTLPATFSQGMFSWFPIFFPIRVSFLRKC